MLGVAPSTLRRYVADFAAHLSADATRPRGRRFTDADVIALQRAREALQQGQTVNRVAEVLGIVDNAEAQPPGSALALIPSIGQALSQALDAARSLRADVDSLAERQDRVSRQVEALADWLRLPWYRRIRKRPPVVGGDQGPGQPGPNRS